LVRLESNARFALGRDLIVKVPFRAFGRVGAQEFTQLEFSPEGTAGKRMTFQQEKLLWMLCFGFVSGHDFSRAGRE
jgi:hypothetical protein